MMVGGGVSHLVPDSNILADELEYPLPTTNPDQLQKRVIALLRYGFLGIYYQTLGAARALAILSGNSALIPVKLTASIIEAGFAGALIFQKNNYRSTLNINDEAINFYCDSQLLCLIISNLERNARAVQATKELTRQLDGGLNCRDKTGLSLRTINLDVSVQSPSGLPRQLHVKMTNSGTFPEGFISKLGQIPQTQSGTGFGLVSVAQMIRLHGGDQVNPLKIKNTTDTNGKPQVEISFYISELTPIPSSTGEKSAEPEKHRDPSEPRAPTSCPLMSSSLAESLKETLKDYWADSYLKDEFASKQILFSAANTWKLAQAMIASGSQESRTYTIKVPKSKGATAQNPDTMSFIAADNQLIKIRYLPSEPIRCRGITQAIDRIDISQERIDLYSQGNLKDTIRLTKALV